MHCLLHISYDVIIIAILTLTQQTGYQPIHMACASGQTAVVCDLLEKYGVDPDSKSQVRL